MEKVRKCKDCERLTILDKCVCINKKKKTQGAYQTRINEAQIAEK